VLGSTRLASTKTGLVLGHDWTLRSCGSDPETMVPGLQRLAWRLSLKW
jgi:hypothetical protein